MTTETLSENKKVLLTGAAGRIGSAFYAYAKDRYDFRLADRNVEAMAEMGAADMVQIDVADLEACQDVCKGIHTVVHLAGDPSGRAGFYGSLLENNVKGVYNMFQAAKDQGCQRVVFASTVQTISGYPLDVQAHPDSPVKPLNMYAVSKCFGEAVAHYFAMAEGLSSIAIRVGSFEGNGMQGQPTARNLSTFVSTRDLCQLIMRAVDTPDVPFAIVHGVSNNRFKRMDLQATRQLLGYAPEDDSFQKFDIGLRYLDRWSKESQ